MTIDVMHRKCLSTCDENPRDKTPVHSLDFHAFEALSLHQMAKNDASNRTLSAKGRRGSQLPREVFTKPS